MEFASQPAAFPPAAAAAEEVPVAAGSNEGVDPTAREAAAVVDGDAAVVEAAAKVKENAAGKKLWEDCCLFDDE